MTAKDNGQPTNGHSGLGSTALFLMFLGGALTGAAAAYLAQPRNREQVAQLAGRAQHAAGLLPHAVHDASLAAKEAFAEAYHASSEAAPALGSK